jgi:hypothetical protein
MGPDKIKTALTAAGIPSPDGDLVHALYRTSTADWYVQTNLGWFWWDARAHKWWALARPPA